MTHSARNDRVHGNPTAYTIVVTAPGGWSAQSADGMSERSGMREVDVVNDRDMYPDDATLIDMNTMSPSDVNRFVISGPMRRGTVPAGYLSRLGNDLHHASVKFDPTMQWPNDGRDPRFGNARSLDYAAHDVYCTLVQRFGGRVMTMGEYRREYLTGDAGNA